MKYFLIILITVFSVRGYSAACCGGGFNIPSVILSDDKSQFTSTLSQSQVIDDVSSSGIWTRRNNKDLTQTFKLEGATLLTDSLQIGLSVPLLQRSIESGTKNTNMGIGDLSIVSAYEVLPELEYSLLKPKGFLFTQLIAPTGKSVYESTSPNGVDITGRGFWSWGLGFILSKIIYNFDFQLNGEAHKSFDRNISNSNQDGDLLLIPGWGQSLTFGGGYSYNSFRFGSSLSFNREDTIHSSGAVTSANGASQQQFATIAYQLNYLIDTQWATTLAYADQRLFGSPQNTTLSQIWSFSLQKRWQR